jgi:hypothetical protein
VNATTIKILLTKLGMLKLNSAKKQLLDRAGEKLQDVLKEEALSLSKKNFYRQSKFDLVKKYATVDLYTGVDFEKERKGVRGGEGQEEEKKMLTEIRMTALKDMVVSIKKQYATGKLGKAAMRVMRIVMIVVMITVMMHVIHSLHTMHSLYTHCTLSTGDDACCRGCC